MVGNRSIILATVTTFWLSSCCLSAQETPSSPSSLPPLGSRVIITAQSQKLNKSGALSDRALVQRPTPIPGLVSWTVESKLHRSIVYCLAVDPEGKWFATGGLDGTVRIWEIATGKFVKALVAHDSYVFGLAWSPDGQTLASGGAWDATARLWHVKSGQLLRTIRHKAYVSRVAWSQDGLTLVVAGGSSGDIGFWDVLKNEVRGELSQGQPVSHVCWSKDGLSVAVACSQQAAQVMNGSLLKLRNQVGEVGQNFSCLSFSPDSTRLATIGTTGTEVWELEGKSIHKLEGPGSVVAWSPNGQLIASALSNGVVQLWKAETGEKHADFRASASMLAWSPESSVLLAASGTHVTAYDVAAGKVQYTKELGGVSPQILWSQSAKMVATRDGTNSVSLWDVSQGKLQRKLDGHSGGITSVAFSPNGRVVATGSADKTTKVWEVSTGKVVQTLSGHEGTVTALSWGVNGKTLATGSADKSIRLWDAPNAKLLQKIDVNQGSIQVVALSKQALASGGTEKTLVLTNSGNGRLLKSVPTGTPRLSLCWTSDGKFVACGGSEDTLGIVNGQTGELVAKLEYGGSPPAVTGLAFGLGGSILASGRGNHTMQLWDVRTSKVVHHIATMAPVLSVQWSNDGRTVIAATHDRCLRSWDAATGLPRATMICEADQVPTVSQEGHVRTVDGKESDLVYVAQTATTQETYSPADFSQKFKWKNAPSQVRVVDGL